MSDNKEEKKEKEEKYPFIMKEEVGLKNSECTCPIDPWDELVPDGNNICPWCWEQSHRQQFN
ncbi:MAG: hypothetical protein IH819_06455 [Bacteroidetes bacterium]|nr:hypothetical protein [Bacteroidota bacterium]